MSQEETKAELGGPEPVRAVRFHHVADHDWTEEHPRASASRAAPWRAGRAQREGRS